MSSKRRGHTTRQGLLLACCEVFSEKGYRDATVADICKVASANIAALNYYFGDKENAYRAAWQYAYEEGIKAHPLEPIDAAPDAPAAERLKAHVISLLTRMNDDGRPTRLERMRIWEMTNPTGIITEVDRELREESRQHMLSCLRELIGAKVSSEVLQLCEASILSQCRMVLPFNRRDLTLLAHRRIDSKMVATLADHIVAFSTAGLAMYGTAPATAARKKRI
jgi:AcrR family transcriptional regulator